MSLPPRCFNWPVQPHLSVLLALLITVCLYADNEHAKRVEVLKNHVKYLASDELEGRQSGHEGNRLAAEYLARQLAESGIEPAAETYFQEFEVVSEVLPGDNNRVEASIDGKISVWEIGKDVLPLGFSADGSVNSQVIFAGYGITSEENEYDDYAGVDAEGKIVLVFRASPDHNNPHGKFSEQATLRYKLNNARRHGAVGILYVSPSDMYDELAPLRADQGGREGTLVAMSARRSIVGSLLGAQESLDSLEAQIKNTEKPASRLLSSVMLKLTADLNFVKKPTANVIGLIPGIDPVRRNEFIVLGAHFDHLGHGGEGSRYNGKDDKIHYGADDNASGTSAILEIGRLLARNPVPRSVLIAGFSGEEMGLLGSSHYINNPIIPLEQTVVMLNLDMVGRVKDKALQVTGTGTSSRWAGLLDSLESVYDFKIARSADGFGPSDHASFYAKDIPVINLFTGLHDDYHRPGDTWEKVNYEGLAQVVEFTEDLIRAIGEFPERPDFVKVASSSSNGSMRFRVVMGIIPDYADHPKGMKITGVREGKPAQKAGMQADDVLVKFGDVDVKNIYDYTYALGKYQPGDEVDVVVLRGAAEEEVLLKVSLEASQARGE